MSRGANAGSAIWSFCETLIATGLCLGLIVLFREGVAVTAALRQLPGVCAVL